MAEGISAKDARIAMMTAGLPLDGIGLEVAPLHVPTVRKSDHRIYYADYTTAEDLRKKNATNPSFDAKDIVDIDFVWKPGRRLADCLPPGTLFDYAIALHVFEHVPNPIGWLSQILEVLRPGGIIHLALPDKSGTFDVFRPQTTAANMIDSWLRDDNIPSPLQIFECLGYASAHPDKPGYELLRSGIPFAEAPRIYEDPEALRFAIHSYVHDMYVDVHCTSYTPQEFMEIFHRIRALGLLNVEISEPVMGPVPEFHVRFTKLGPPLVELPRKPTLWRSIRGGVARLRAGVVKQLGKGTVYHTLKKVRNLTRRVVRQK